MLRLSFARLSAPVRHFNTSRRRRCNKSSCARTFSARTASDICASSSGKLARIPSLASQRHKTLSVERAMRPGCLCSRSSTRKSANGSQNKRWGVGVRRASLSASVGRNASRIISAGKLFSPATRLRSASAANSSARVAGRLAKNWLSRRCLARGSMARSGPPEPQRHHHVCSVNIRSAAMVKKVCSRRGLRRKCRERTR